jgi:hypothetical protein
MWMDGGGSPVDDASGPVVYAEPGSSWWPLCWGPGFALVGALVETVTPGLTHWAMWALLAGALTVASAVWIYGRRRVCSLSVSRASLVMGREELAVSRIAAVTDVGSPVGTRVLGGGWTVPKGTSEVPLLLDDGQVLLAWARDPEALSEALRSVLP